MDATVIERVIRTPIEASDAARCVIARSLRRVTRSHPRRCRWCAIDLSVLTDAVREWTEGQR